MGGRPSKQGSKNPATDFTDFGWVVPIRRGGSFQAEARRAETGYGKPDFRSLETSEVFQFIV
jgi:hypothetical protein